MALAFAGLSLAARPATADIVPNPLRTLDGTVGWSCHGGPYCSPDTCATDADCDGGDICKDTPLCTGIIPEIRDLSGISPSEDLPIW